MKQALQEHIEAKVINFLRDANAPIHASRIAVQIQERREDTLQAIQRLVKNRTVAATQDLALFNSTGETVAYVLVDAGLRQSSSGSIPLPPPQPASRSPRDRAVGR